MILLDEATAEAVTGYEMAVRRERVLKTRWSESGYWEDMKEWGRAIEDTYRHRLIALASARRYMEEAERDTLEESNPEKEAHLRAAVAQWNYVRQL
jgi:hypothetical protein